MPPPPPPSRPQRRRPGAAEALSVRLAICRSAQQAWLPSRPARPASAQGPALSALPSRPARPASAQGPALSAPPARMHLAQLHRVMQLSQPHQVLPPADAHRRAAHPRRQRQGRGQEGTRRGRIPCEISKNTLHLSSFSPSSSRSGSGIARAPKRRPRRCQAGPAGRRGEDVRRTDQSPDLSSSSPVKIQSQASKSRFPRPIDQSGGGC